MSSRGQALARARRHRGVPTHFVSERAIEVQHGRMGTRCRRTRRSKSRAGPYPAGGVYLNQAVADRSPHRLAGALLMRRCLQSVCRWRASPSPVTIPWPLRDHPAPWYGELVADATSWRGMASRAEREDTGDIPGPSFKHVRRPSAEEPCETLSKPAKTGTSEGTAEGLSLQKSRTRNPGVLDWGTYMLVEPDHNRVVAGPGMSLGEVEAALNE